MRFTVRRMMSAVAVASLILWGVSLWRLSGRYAYQALCTRATLEILMHDRLSPDASEEYAKNYPKRQALMIAHLEGEAEKWERAARYPWLPVESDSVPSPPPAE